MTASLTSSSCSPASSSQPSAHTASSDGEPATTAYTAPAFLSRRLQLYIWLSGVFITALIVANLLGGLLVPLPLPWGTTLVSAGIFIFPVTFLLTDLLNEFYGAAGARQVTWLGFGMALLTFGFFWLGEHLPIAPESVLSRSVYLAVSSQFTHMVLASLTAYLLGQFLDIAVFGAFRKLTDGRLLWLRATGSTLISQLIDSVVVIFIAFWGSLSLPQLIEVATGNYWVKFLVAVCITPLLYAGHSAIRRWIPAARQSADG